MAEEKYTWDNIIIDPTSDRAKKAVGKECYFGDSPTSCLNNANKNSNPRILTEIPDNGYFRFKSKNMYWGCIIVKKEEPKPKYVPFESAQEFLDEYYKSETGRINDGLEHYLSTRGLWLKCDDHYELVTYIYDNGITIDGISINWKTLFDSYIFLDGSHCGKLMEESNALQ